MYNMTLEEAVANASGFQEQLSRAKEALAEYPRNSLQWRRNFSLMNEAKVMLEEYLGYAKKNSYGEDIHVPGQIQLIASKALQLKEASNLGERFSNRTFANFEAKRDMTAFKICSNYANNENLFRSKRNSLMLLGGVGSGKTHLAAAISNLLIDKGVPVLFGTFSDHLEHIREEFDHTGQREYLNRMKTTPMLVLDDIGKEKKTDWTQEILFDVVNYRYEHLLPMIVTTNFDVDGIANYIGSAIFSRLYEMSSAVTTSGADYRRQ